MRKENLGLSTISGSSLHIGIGTTLTADHYCSMHFHPECEIYQVHKGKTEFYIYDKLYKLQCDDIIFLNSNTPHATSRHKDDSYFCLQFNIDVYPNGMTVPVSNYLLQFINIFSNNVVVFEKGTALNNALSTYIDKIINEYTQKSPAYDVFIKSYFYNILALLFRNDFLAYPSIISNITDLKKLLPIIEYIEINYNSQITLSQLSKIIHVDKSYLCRLFKKTLNTSFVQYLNFIRICEAEKLLLTTNKSISEIAYETGFSSLQYFNRVFKKHKTYSPKIFKKVMNN